MKSLLFLMLFLGASLGSVYGAESNSSVPQEVRELTDFYERRIRQGVQDFLGPNMRAVVNVYIKAKVVSSFEPETSVDQVLGNNAGLLVGPYFATSTELRAMGATQDITIRVEAAEVSIQVEASVGPDLRKQLEGVVKSTLRDVPLTISVKSNLKPASIASPPLKEQKGIDGFLQRFSALIPLAASLVLLLGIFVIASGLRSAAHEISEGIKSARPSRGGSASMVAAPRPMLPKAAESDSRKEIVSRSGSLPTFASPEESRRNIQILERYLRDSPNTVLRSLGEGPEDLLGLSYLISRMTAESNTLLKDLLGIEKLVKLNTYRTGGEIVGFDVNGWVQGLVERVEIKHLAGGDVIEQSVTPEQAALLWNAGEDRLLEAALKIDEAPVWRVVSEFISSDFLRRGGHTFDDQVWLGLLKGSKVTDSALVKTGVTKLVEKVRVAASENAVQMRDKMESREHFLRRILPLLVESILERDLGEDDRVVEQVMSETPHFAELVFDRVWTPARLDIVADAPLKAMLLGPSFDNERRAFLLYALPEAQAQRLESLLPEGTMKKIVLDIAARLRTTSDGENKVSIRNWVRQFLDAVRIEVAEGRFELKNPPKNSARKTSAEVIDDVYAERKAS